MSTPFELILKNKRTIKNRFNQFFFGNSISDELKGSHISRYISSLSIELEKLANVKGDNKIMNTIYDNKQKILKSMIFKMMSGNPVKSSKNKMWQGTESAKKRIESLRYLMVNTSVKLKWVEFLPTKLLKRSKLNLNEKVELLLAIENIKGPLYSHIERSFKIPLLEKYIREERKILDSVFKKKGIVIKDDVKLDTSLKLNDISKYYFIYIPHNRVYPIMTKFDKNETIKCTIENSIINITKDNEIIKISPHDDKEDIKKYELYGVPNIGFMIYIKKEKKNIKYIYFMYLPFSKNNLDLMGLISYNVIFREKKILIDCIINRRILGI